MKGGVVVEKVKLRDLRLKLGMTQQELADSLQMNSRYISMVESGIKPTSDKMLQKVELLFKARQHPGESHIDVPETCPRCAVLESDLKETRDELRETRAELREARAVIRDQASALASALASKPSPAAGRVCGVGSGRDDRPRLVGGA